LADCFDEFRDRAGEIEAFDRDEPGDIRETMLAVGVHENTQRQAAFLEALEFPTADHSQK
jgi:hypothetical protein